MAALVVLWLLLSATIASAGCSGNSSWTFDTTNHSNQTLATTNGIRSFWVHIPASYNASLAHPVVLSFHGYDEDERINEDATGFSKEGLLIAGTGLVAVYPLAAYGSGKFGKPARSWMGAPYASPEADDLDFVLSILDALQGNLCVDNNRIYAAGMSNGGGFVNLLACTPQTRQHFAAFAPVSPALYAGTHPFSPNCTIEPGRAVPLITFHGSADEMIPYDGRTASDMPPALGPPGANMTTPSIVDWLAGWAERDGCEGNDSNSTVASSREETTTPYAGTTETSWPSGCADGAQIKAFLITNGTHRWPSTVGADAAPYAFNATQAQIVPFFAQYSNSARSSRSSGIWGRMWMWSPSR
ncbi:hypothetical protein HMN09_01309100 [Mycena chlorophos]|uniref:feruloyl esterase n=1 Tax=Mycena chlorophos TaxID=658473 RepID=A0A8H6VS60_MYCCL|nr:hypothetical protein HMN09_01309100 [Mycena chlorophos]